LGFFCFFKRDGRPFSEEKKSKQHVICKPKFWPLYWCSENQAANLLVKKLNFQAILTQKNLINTFITPTNHFINFTYIKSGQKTQNQTDLVLGFLAWIWFFM
jgi:hypothetical protein